MNGRAEHPEHGPSVVVDRVVKSFPQAYGFWTWLRHNGSPPRRTALDDVSISVRRGELFGLLGPNGAGKTTLLKCIAGLIRPERGSITIASIDVLHDALRASAKLGLCTSEERSFYFRLTGRQNLRFFGTLAGLGADVLERRIEDVVRMVDLQGDLDRHFSTYSSGMRQRLALGRALLGDPDVLLLDEPTRGVDPVHAEAIRRLIRDTLVGRCGKTVVLATNLLDEAWALCDRVAVLSRGKVVALGPPHAIDVAGARPRGLKIVLDRADERCLARLRAVAGVTGVTHVPETGADAVFVEIDSALTSLNQFLYAAASSESLVLSLHADERRPADIFTDLTRADDAR